MEKLEILRKLIHEHHLLFEVISIPAIFLICIFAWYLSSKIISSWLQPRLRALNKNYLVDLILKEEPLAKFAHLLPGILLYQLGGVTPIPNHLIQQIATIWVGWAALTLFMDLMDACHNIYNTTELSKDKPVKVFLQVAKLILFLVGAILTVSVLLGQSPVYLLSGLGALTAVLMLIFRDTIMSVVASLQIQAHDMVRIGDWIEMPKYHADGDVIDIALHTVKVQNWDKTITTIPMQKLIEESFRNWRGMKESGGRRICRNLLIDQRSVAFIDAELFAELQKIRILKPYLLQRQAEIESFNQSLGVQESHLANGRRMTNIGTFRAYVLAYLQANPALHKGMTMMVRVLEPTAAGIPMQIYCFTATTVWLDYERIQSDILDHLLAVIPLFNLSLFQSPSSLDMQRIHEGLKRF